MSRSLYSRLRARYGTPVDAVTRREFLQASLAAGTAFLLSGPHALAQNRRPHGGSVIVIGAGLAGLAAAYELTAAGYDVTVLEARERISGRVTTLHNFIPGRWVEGGGEMIGSNHPTWLAYAKKFGLSLFEPPHVERTFELEGKVLTESEAEALFEDLDEINARIDKNAAPVLIDEPWNTPDAKTLDARNMADWIEALDAPKLAKDALTAELTANIGVSTKRQSFLGFMTEVKGGGLERYWTETEVYHCAGGNQRLAEKFAEGIGPERIRLGLPVKSLKIAGGRVTVTAADGRSFTADDAVLAVPPSVWNEIDFEPALPEQLMPQMGSNVKYLIALKEPFWLAGGLSPDSQSDGDVQQTWEGTAGQDGDGPVAMTAFSGGPGSDAMRAISAKDRDAAYAKALAGRYPNLTDAFIRSVFMDWPATPWTRASYSFPAPGQVTTIGPLLQESIGGRLHFAGEHTCYKFVGYMEGALTSGVTIARRLALRDGVAAAGP